MTKTRAKSLFDLGAIFVERARSLALICLYKLQPLVEELAYGCSRPIEFAGSDFRHE